MHITLKELLEIKEISEILKPFCIKEPSAVIGSNRLFSVGLALSGIFRDKPENLMLFGEDEYSYIQSLDPENSCQRLQRLLSEQKCAGMIFLKGCMPDFLSSGGKQSGNIMISEQGWEKTATIVSEILDELLAPVMTKHGVFMDIYGVGVLLTGESGIGKSELALDLISRGHRLVADDVVEIRKIRFDKIKGQAPNVLKGYIQIKGLGIINVEKLFGIISTRSSKRIEMVIKLIEDDDFTSVQYLGTEECFTSYFDVSLPLKTIPVARGRDMAKIIEVATRDFMMKRKGVNQSVDFEHHRRDILQEFYNELKG